MELKGNYSSDVSYSVGDVVLFTDGFVYHKQNASGAGVPPTDTSVWGKVNQTLAEAVKMVIDGIGIANSDDVSPSDIPSNISENAILLNSSTEDSTKQFLITVDDDGELTATEVEAEGGGT